MEVSSRYLPRKEGESTLALPSGASVVLRSVFETVAYADVFDYPMTASEVYRYLTSTNASVEDVTRALANKAHFTRAGDYFTLRGREDVVEIRKRRTEIAVRLWEKALRYVRIIAALPFVRMVAVTGSLAMNNTEEGKDVDFLIVTAPNRLWTCRALTLLVARLAKLDGVSLCPNYLVTTRAMKLSEHSLYVAHELAQMIPLAGMDTYEEMLRLNDWIYEYLPNASSMPELALTLSPVRIRTQGFQRVLEIIFRLPLGDWLERWEMNRKIGKLSREQASSVESYFSADVCKGHLDRHGKNIVTALAVRLQKTI